MLAGSLEKQPRGSGHSNQTAIPFSSQGMWAGHSSRAQLQGWRRSWESSAGPSPDCLSQSLAGPGACIDTSQEFFQRCGRDLGGRRCTASSKEGHGELQAEPGKTAKWEEEEEPWEELYLPWSHCGSRMLLMAGRAESGVVEAGQRHELSRE